MSGYSASLWLLAEARARQRRYLASEPRAAQERALLKLVRRAERTAFGREHDFSAVQSVASYRARVPVARYENLRPWFERALQGESDVTWPGKIAYFAMTSGTTGGNKYLPISSDSIAQQQRGGFEPIASYLSWTKDRALLDGKGLLLGSSSELERRPSGVLVGDNTGIMARHMPWLVSSKYLPSKEIRRIANWDEKMLAVAREAVEQDVRLVAGTPAWFPGLFDAVLRRAAELRLPCRTLCEVWPELRLLTGGGIAYEPYRALIELRLGRRIPYVETYNATEGGIIGVQDVADEPGLLLLPDNGVFYELVPFDEFSRENPRRLCVWEAELEVPYVLLVSTMSGLFSYAIGDVIRFVERFPHRFVFEGRVQAFLNVQGEHVSQGELERAVLAASRSQAVRVRDFTVSADVGVDGGSAARHVVLIEFDGRAPDPVAFAERFDRDLSAGNEDYATHRGTQHGLRHPKLSVLPVGSFEEWMRRRGKQGGQHKVPRLVLDPMLRASLEQVGRDLDGGVAG